MTKDTAMTTLISAPISQLRTETDRAAAAAALAVLEETWSYYMPESPVATRDMDTQEGVVAYYEAA